MVKQSEHYLVTTNCEKECSICGVPTPYSTFHEVPDMVIYQDTPDYIKEIEAEIEEQEKSVIPQ